jgi:plasmid maintenance system killer protein
MIIKSEIYSANNPDHEGVYDNAVSHLFNVEIGAQIPEYWRYHWAFTNGVFGYENHIKDDTLLSIDSSGEKYEQWTAILELLAPEWVDDAFDRSQPGVYMEKLIGDGFEFYFVKHNREWKIAVDFENEAMAIQFKLSVL